MYLSFDFPFSQAGFQEDEWVSVPRSDKVMIRDYHFFRGDTEKASFFGFFETDRTMRRAQSMYELQARPLLQLSIANLENPFVIR